MKAGRYFLHEHPAGATSWKLRCVRKIAEMDGVTVVTAHQCAFGLPICDHWGSGLCKKPKKFMTNCPQIALVLAPRCANALTIDNKNMRVLNRVIRYEESGICYEADQCHAEQIIEAMGLATIPHDCSEKSEQLGIRYSQ